MDIRGKVAIVTGAASGLGFATAERFAKEGARVAIVDLNAEATAAAAARIGALPVACDVADAVSSEAAMATITGQLGAPGVLVSCAGIAPGKRIVGRNGPMPLDEFERVIRVNLIGTFNWLRLAAHAMTGNEPNADGERGVIVNTASIAAFEGQIGQAAYGASKGGVVSLTLPAARELASHGIRVAAIAPGLMGTAMVEALPQEVKDAIVETLPFPRRFGHPQEFADLAFSMVQNPMVNGSVYRLDAALRMQG
ncbi:SDR family NAD(P)-dependent oxidoreductase [Brucella tritici]|uniref:SDR family NAD(P)-dependent oxidoreductase n=1 Tax=Brucella tritici TaxID=94626 RepID=A0A6L3YKE2_9HYPH|nr:SDR family NAD(P)-dependent oxidoreductase [Brucella tritici]KAB2683348.1 SDR family NAD(P)-dependent oxidoreductase [Brucella tritici]